MKKLLAGFSWGAELAILAGWFWKYVETQQLVFLHEFRLRQLLPALLAYAGGVVIQGLVLRQQTQVPLRIRQKLFFVTGPSLFMGIILAAALPFQARGPKNLGAAVAELQLPPEAYDVWVQDHVERVISQELTCLMLVGITALLYASRWPRKPAGPPDAKDPSAFEISCNEIRFSNGAKTAFEYPVAGIVRKGDMLVVRISPPRGAIYGITLTGKMLWQIEPRDPVAELAYEIRGDKIQFRNGHTTRFQHPIFRVVEFEDVLVVETCPPKESTFHENIFGLSMSGEVLWQIEPQYPRNEPNAAFGVRGENGYAVVTNIKNLVLHLEPSTGEIVKRHTQMR